MYLLLRQAGEQEGNWGHWWREWMQVKGLVLEHCVPETILNIFVTL